MSDEKNPAPVAWKIDAKCEEYFKANGEDAQGERASIIKYGFHLTSNGDEFVLVDPVIRKANKGKGKAGRGTGGNLKVLLREAVKARSAHLKANQPEVAPEPETAPVAAPEPVSEVVPDPPEVVVVPDPPEVVVVPDPPADNVVPLKPKRAKLEAPKDPPKEISGDDIELDNTGKREKKAKVEKEKIVREPKGNRYGRTSLLMLANPNITTEEVAKQASMSLAMADYCIQSFLATTQVLTEAGLLKELPKRDPKAK